MTREEAIIKVFDIYSNIAVDNTWEDRVKKILVALGIPKNEIDQVWEKEKLLNG